MGTWWDGGYDLQCKWTTLWNYNSHLRSFMYLLSLSFIFPTKYGIPKSLKVGHWLSQCNFQESCSSLCRFMHHHILKSSTASSPPSGLHSTPQNPNNAKPLNSLFPPKKKHTTCQHSHPPCPKTAGKKKQTMVSPKKSSKFSPASDPKTQEKIEQTTHPKNPPKMSNMWAWGDFQKKRVFWGPTYKKHHAAGSRQRHLDQLFSNRPVLQVV